MLHLCSGEVQPQKTLDRGRKTSCFGLKNTVVVGQNTAGDGLPSYQKYNFLASVTRLVLVQCMQCLPLLKCHGPLSKMSSSLPFRKVEKQYKTVVFDLAAFSLNKSTIITVENGNVQLCGFHQGIQNPFNPTITSFYCNFGCIY